MFLHIIIIYYCNGLGMRNYIIIYQNAKQQVSLRLPTATNIYIYMYDKYIYRFFFLNERQTNYTIKFMLKT